jgi:hypothetical protein
MQHLLEADLELAVKDGFLYLPLPFDPAIAGEVHTVPTARTLIQCEGRHFAKTLSLPSLLEAYEKICPESHAQIRGTFLQRYGEVPSSDGIAIGGKLETILFRVLPHFIRRKRSRERRKLSEKEILDIIGERIELPPRYSRDAQRHFDTKVLGKVLRELEKAGSTPPFPPEGRISSANLRAWLVGALEARIARSEIARIRQQVAQQGEFGRTGVRRVATLLYLADQGALEIDGFGFSRIGSTEEYYVYKHTGEYALKDFYGRPYLFPDCRVAVSTILPLKPFVMDRYKHPFLEAHDSGQDICFRGLTPPSVFTATAVITALEGGMNALLYGYSSRRRNGYHSLDRTLRPTPIVDVQDYTPPDPTDYPVIRKRHILDVDFEDYRVPKDHPKIASGEIAITNSFTP